MSQGRPSDASSVTMKGLSVLGSTGSIGVSTLDVVARHRDRFRVVALTANGQVERLFEQCVKFQPEYAVMADPVSAQQLELLLNDTDLTTIVLAGVEGLEHVAQLEQVDLVMAAIVGAAGLKPTLSAAKAGKRILLANKEALVMSGRLFMEEVKNNNAEILPIDSEHNAIFQCMPRQFEKGLDNVGVRKILLTASGGPFLNYPVEQFSTITPDQACAHPNWDMGRKISVDSATMMNKGLEVIEACWLFNTNVDRIQVVLHPQSVIHSMVEYNDGSVLAQLGNPDMRTPIAHAMAWPDRIDSGVKSLDLFEVAQLNFQEPDFERFPCLKFAYDVMQQGGTSSTVLNAANEIAVQSFLDEVISFDQIPYVIEKVLSVVKNRDADSLKTILDVDAESRACASDVIGALKSTRRLVH